MIAASDSHGHVLFFSPGSEKGGQYSSCPEEMFYHTDYRPLLLVPGREHLSDKEALVPNYFLISFSLTQ